MYPSAGLIRNSKGNLYGTTYEGGRLGNGVIFRLDPTATLTVLHTFTGGAGGGAPLAGLIGDSVGNLYGTTRFGGEVGGVGVVFKLDTSHTETVLQSFTGSNGSNPEAALIRDSAGNLYGTTTEGGPSGYGVVFKVDTTGTETVLHSFTRGADGGAPYAGLIRDSAGNLYGTTTEGGTSGYGVVFKVDTTGTETVLYNFAGGTDGASPYAGLIQDSAGNLYGTAQSGGDLRCGPGAGFGCGVVFKVDTAGTETVLYTFKGGADGLDPVGGLLQDSAGNLFGTTAYGGIFNSTCTSGCGVVFKLQP